MGQIKGYSHYMCTKGKESWKAALCFSTKGQKAARQRKAPRIKKDTYSKLWGCSCRREGWSQCRCRWMRTMRAIHKSMRQRFGIWGLSSKSGVQIGNPGPYCKGGGPGSHPTPSHIIGKRTVNTTLTKGHHAQTQALLEVLYFFTR
jgi:hypothetical protein